MLTEISIAGVIVFICLSIHVAGLLFIAEWLLQHRQHADIRQGDTPGRARKAPGGLEAAMLIALDFVGAGAFLLVAKLAVHVEERSEVDCPGDTAKASHLKSCRWWLAACV